MRMELADELEEFVRLGHLWSNEDCAAMVDRLNAGVRGQRRSPPRPTGPIPRRREHPHPDQRRARVAAGADRRHRVPEVWKLIEGIRDGMPDAELRTRIEVMNRRLARLFVEETA